MLVVTSAVRIDADGLPEDQYGNDTTIEDEDANSVALLSNTNEQVEAVVCSPDKIQKSTEEENNYNYPADRKKRRLLPSFAVNVPRRVEVKKKSSSQTKQILGKGV